MLLEARLLPLMTALLALCAHARAQDPTPSAQPAAAVAEPGVMAVEMLVEDGQGRIVTNLKADEVRIEQDGERQALGSLEFLPESRAYELRYAPKSGQPGPVLIRILRGGSRVRGLDGPSVKPHWIPPPPAFELPLRAALLAPVAPNELACELAPLRFETRGDTLHHSFVVEVPLSEVAVAQAQARLAFLLRVTSAAGRMVHAASVEQTITFEDLGELTRSVKRFIWIDHAHLTAGDYVVELAVGDQNSTRRSVRRSPLTVLAPSPGLRVSSPVFLLGKEGLMQGVQVDNPFRLEDSALVPVLRPVWVVGTELPLSLLAYVYPDPASKEPISATLEIERDGVTRGKGTVPLPAADSDGRVRFLGGLKLRGLETGSYDVRFVTRQGAAVVEERAVVQVVELRR